MDLLLAALSYIVTPSEVTGYRRYRRFFEIIFSKKYSEKRTFASGSLNLR
jgi:hypothetical protein